MHAMIGAQYAEYLLLDGAWVAKVAGAFKFLKHRGLSLPQPKTYSERRDGLSKFLAQLARDRKELPVTVSEFRVKREQLREMFPDSN
jgi:hypothetical protein